MKNTYSPKEFGTLIGKTTNTLQRWDRAGVLQAHRSLTNRRYYTHDQYLQVIGHKAKEKKRVVYCRVSSIGQKKDLISQRSAIETFCLNAGKVIDEKFEDMGSGLNYGRKNFIKLMELVEQGLISEIVIAHKDRLVRFGFEWFEKFCYDHGTKILVMNVESTSPEEEMTKDLLSIIHCFSSRLYGLRKYKKKIIEMTKEHENDQT
ncbi:MAG: IS607 family transposase [Chlamydiales bacterium]|nr:IS607 family transposase [Chlamydiales bacterium]